MKKSQTGQRYYQAFDVTPYLETGLTKQEILELKDAFDLLDPNSIGKLELTCTITLI
jgi:Ca2+-binding EF-hand superfamily protein